MFLFKNNLFNIYYWFSNIELKAKGTITHTGTVDRSLQLHRHCMSVSSPHLQEVTRAEGLLSQPQAEVGPEAQDSSIRPHAACPSRGYISIPQKENEFR